MTFIIGIIGGNGKMGKWFSEFFARQGFKVIISDIETKLTNKDLVKQADAVIFSVPISKTVEVIEEVLPFTREDQILLDFTALKISAVNAMLNSQCEVLGLHPMFGPHLKSMKGQTIIACRAREKKHTKTFIKIFAGAGARIKAATPEEHDKMMAVIQGLTHFSTISLGNALQKLGVDIKESLEYTSPIYKIRMDMIGRMLAQDPVVYAEIETLNPYANESVKALAESVNELAKCVDDKDTGEFVNYFKKAAGHLGEFKEEAMDESNYLIEKLNEKLNDKTSSKLGKSKKKK